MRILMINHYRGIVGGIERNVAVFTRAMRRRGHYCALAAGVDASHDVETFTSLFHESSLCYELSGRPQDPSLNDLVQNVRPDVIYVHKMEDVTPLVKYAGQIRLVRMIHDHDLCCPRSHKYYTWNHQICRRPMGLACWLDLAFIKRDRTSRLGVRLVNLPRKREQIDRHLIFDRLIVGSQFMRDELITNGLSEDRITIIPPAVPPLEGEATPLPHEARVLFVGQMVRGKGVHYLISALKSLADQGIHFEARLVGDGPWRDWIQTKIENEGLDRQVQVLGYQKGADLAEQYAWARVVVVPSIWPEPFGMVGLEAMHAARPVVAFDVGGISQWLEDGKTGLLVPRANYRVMASALEKLFIDDPFTQELASNAKKRVEQRFGFDAYIDTLETELAGGKQVDSSHQTPEEKATSDEASHEEIPTEEIEM